MIILRYTRWNEVQHATVPEDLLRAQYPQKLRVKKIHNSPIGRIQEVEGTGDHHRDRVDLFFAGGRDRFGRELKPGNSTSRFGGARLLDHRSHVRVLADKDQATIDSYDSEIARLRQELDDARKGRAEFLKACWRRARPLGLGELEDRAKADLAARHA